YVGVQGVFAVAISGNGKVAAAGGILKDSGNRPPFQGLLRAYNADNGQLQLDYQGLVGPQPAPLGTGAAAPARPDTGRAQRVGWVSLSADGGVLAAAADKIYVFVRGNSGKFPDQPTEVITF